MKQTPVYIWILLVVILVWTGFLLAKYLQERKARKTVSRQYAALFIAKTDTGTEIEWKEAIIDNHGIIKWYTESSPVYSLPCPPCPECDTSTPGTVIIRRDTCIEDNKLNTYIDTLDRPDYFMMYTIRTRGSLESFWLNKLKFKQENTTINHIVHDTVLVPVPLIKNHWGAYAGLAANNFKEFPGLEAGLWWEFKNKWGIEAGALYVDQHVYGSLRARFTFK